MNWFSNYNGDSPDDNSQNYVPYTSSSSSSSSSNTARILDGQRQNGLVQIAILPEDPDAMFRMHERVSNRNKATSYYDALNGTLESKQLAASYFSAENIDSVQEQIKQGVYEQSSGTITSVPSQDIDQMKTLMRNAYLQYAEHSPVDVPGQVARLNDIVVRHMIPRALSDARSYQQYLQDQSMLRVPMARGVMSDRIYKQLEPRPFVDVRPMKPFL
jgi:hypothetical protein